MRPPVKPAGAPAASVPRRGAALLVAVLIAALFSYAPAASADEPANPLPVFEFSGIITDKETLRYNPTNEFIFPSVFHASEYFRSRWGSGTCTTHRMIPRAAFR